MFRRQAVLTCVFCVVLGAFFARLPVTIAQISSQLGTKSDVDWATAFAETRKLILERHVDKPSDEVLLKGAIKGMTEALNDPYTEFVPPAERDAFEKDLTGQFVGIGATVNVRDSYLTIVYPLENSPAYAAGLIPDDKVTAINGKSTKGLTVEDCVKQLLGEPNTEVVLTIERLAGEPEGQPKVMEVKINRQAISATSIKGFRWDGELRNKKGAWQHVLDAATGTAYVRLTQFTPGCGAELLKTVQDAGRQIAAAKGPLAKGSGPKTPMPASLVLDLRDNPGGLLEQALEIVDMYLDSGVMLSAKGRDGRGPTYRAKQGAPLGDVSTVILVNQSSASASEIVSGSLQESGKAVIVGTRSFGKGLVQRIERLDLVPGAELKLTEQHYFLPSGRMIQRTDDSKTWGIDPSPGFYVPLSDDEATDIFLTRREMDVIRPAGAPRLAARVIPGFKPRPNIDDPEARWGDPAWLEGTLRDKQLAAAVSALQKHLASGKWEPTGQDVPDQIKSIAITEITRLERVRERYNRELDRLDKRMAALEEGNPQAAKARPDFWPDTTDIVGGKIEVFDKDGRRIAILDVTGPDVERWLLDADLKLHPTPAPGDTSLQNKPEDGAVPAPKQ